MSERSIAYVGYTTRPRDGWERFAPPVKAPSNYKDPEKIASYEAAMRDKQFREAATGVMQCELDDMVVLDSEGTVLDGRQDHGVNKVLDYLSDHTHVAVIGATLWRYAVLTAQFTAGKRLKPNHQWLAISLRNGFPFLADAEQWVIMFDPVHAILCTTTFDDKLPSVAEAYGFQGGTDTAEERARFARHLCDRLGA